MHTRKTMLLALAVGFLAGKPALASADKAAEGIIPPEVTTAVRLSSSDINRVVCPGTMNDLIFSREKGLEGHFSGNSAYLEFQIAKRGDELTYASKPTELFLVCDNVVYSLIVTPQNIPSVTLRLAPSPVDAVKKNIDRHRDMPLEKRALNLIRAAAVGDYPASYRVMAADIPVRLSVDLDTRLIRVVDVEGVGLRLKEFKVKSLAGHRLHLSESHFLAPDIGEGILAVAVELHDLGPGESTRVLVVEQKEGER